MLAAAKRAAQSAPQFVSKFAPKHHRQCFRSIATASRMDFLDPLDVSELLTDDEKMIQVGIGLLKLRNEQRQSSSSAPITPTWHRVL